MSEAFECFMRLYSGLSREGPGDVASMMPALTGLPQSARIFDAACGSGADTKNMLDVSSLARVVGVDKQQQFIDAAKARGLRADFYTGDMLEPDGLFDLVWCAGAVYFVGVETALNSWRPHLKPAGRIGFSEIVWLTDTPSAPAKKFWHDAFPAMGNITQMSERIEKLGFRVISAKPLGRSGWETYYAGLAANIAKIKSGHITPVMAQTLAETETEIELFNAHPGQYDYAVFVAEPI